MILYHFTSFYNLKNVGPRNIQAAGLRASAAGMGDWASTFEFGLKPRSVVWLTSDPDPKILFEKPADCRIEVTIASSDKRLVHWIQYARKHSRAPHLIDKAGVGGMTSWWLYLGDIPLRKIRAVEYADPARRAATKR